MGVDTVHFVRDSVGGFKLLAFASGCFLWHFLHVMVLRAMGILGTDLVVISLGWNGIHDNNLGSYHIQRGIRLLKDAMYTIGRLLIFVY